ncbi:alpha/beta-hydrolase [Ceratobasidium sp. AG-I]|nr:alpha/beta-hydrolase [Ceratobasidium sp. AG-I]
MRQPKALHTCLTLWLWLASLASTLAASPIVSGSSGLSYIGLRNATSGQDYFLGIPFAKPPVGSLRFKPPLLWSAGNTSTVNATQPGYSCEQTIEGIVTNRVSEDCLTLNIWKPTNVTGKIPVMVWIYGGSFSIGDSYSYPGNFLVERAISIGKPVIYVAMNYRLGLFGFPPGQAAADAGALNLGLKDQRLALKWVQKNIGYFGGDSHKVTIFGESAGSISIACQTLYHGGKSDGLFRGIILESGFATSLAVPMSNDSVKEAAFRFVANATGCAGSHHPFECVRNAPADTLSKANKDAIEVKPYYRSVDQAPVIYGPTRALGDDYFPETPVELLRKGKFAKVPFITGTQLDEGTLFGNGTSMKTEQDIINWLIARFPGLYPGVSNVTLIRELLEYYPVSPAAGSPYGTGDETFGLGAQFKRFSSMLGDVAFQAPRRDLLRTANKFKVKGWSYLMKQPPVDFVPFLGVRHGGEVPFVLQTVPIQVPSAPQDQVELGHIMGDYWINFAYHLDPNGKGDLELPKWSTYGSKAIALQFLASNVTTIKDSDRTAATNFIIANTPHLYN